MERERPNNRALAAGHAAPDFTLRSSPDQTVSLGDFAGEAVVLVFYPADFSPVCGDEVTLFNDPAITKVHLDGEQMKRVLINLVENAIEAMEGKGRVDLITHLDLRRQRVCIDVRDSGGGIPPQLRDKLFLPYFTTKKHGTGLGLFVTRTLIHDHNGSIDFTALDRGTRFRVGLPSAESPPPLVEPSAAEVKGAEAVS